jgi:hypothetical protein
MKTFEQGSTDLNQSTTNYVQPDKKPYQSYWNIVYGSQYDDHIHTCSKLNGFVILAPPRAANYPVDGMRHAWLGLLTSTDRKF